MVSANQEHFLSLSPQFNDREHLLPMCMDKIFDEIVTKNKGRLARPSCFFLSLTTRPGALPSAAFRGTQTSARIVVKGGPPVLLEFSAVTLTHLPIAGMHPASEPLLIRNPLQKNGELPLFVLSDSSQQRLRVFAGNAAYRLECRASFFSDVQSIPAAVIGILAAHDES
jgi:hypothetical protein